MSGLLETPKYRDLIYDIGLHKGEDTLFYLSKGFRVVAIEADPDLVCHCVERFRDFIRRGRLTIVQGAIVDPATNLAGKKVAFFKNDQVSVWGTVCEDWAKRNDRRGSPSRRIEVDALNLTDVISAHGVPRYMKIDIEGADTFCLVALARFLHRPDYLSIESDRGGYANLAREIDTLVALGYDAFQAIEQATIPRVQRPPRPAREGRFIRPVRGGAARAMEVEGSGPAPVLDGQRRLPSLRQGRADPVLEIPWCDSTQDCCPPRSKRPSAGAGSQLVRYPLPPSDGVGGNHAEVILGLRASSTQRSRLPTSSPSR